MSRHLLIAGTGRAGTSFLVRYLHELGLETHLSRPEADSDWNEAARAGLEDLPLPDREDLPYVIKSPWTYQLIDELLGSEKVQIDAAILPMRDLIDAASSRSIVEMQHIHRDQAWMSDRPHIWEDFGHTPGGIVYSLNPVDQARLLATGFHRLLERLVQADIPVVLLAFPRSVDDPAYLYKKLAPILPASVTEEAAHAAHKAVADPSMVRVGVEMRPGAAGIVIDGPPLADLERAALVRSVQQLRLEVAEAQRKAEAAMAATAGADTHRRAAEEAFAEMVREREEAIGKLRTAIADAASMAAAQEAAMMERDAALAERDAAIARRDEEAAARDIVSRGHADALAVLDAANRELERTRGSARVFLGQYLPRLWGFLLRR